MKVTLTIRNARQRPAGYGDVGHHQENTLVLEGTPAEIQAGLDELFDADRANDLRRELGLKATSASDSSGQQ